MEEPVRKSNQSLGIAALITAIITFVLAVIPCVGMIAIVPGIIAVVLAIVGLSQATRPESPRGILIAGLIIGIIATIISVSQFFVIGKVARHADKWPTEINDIISDVKDNVLKDIEDNNINIRIESNGDTSNISIRTKTNHKGLETLEDLEKGDTKKADTIRKGK